MTLLAAACLAAVIGIPALIFSIKHDGRDFKITKEKPFMVSLSKPLDNVV